MGTKIKSYCPKCFIQDFNPYLEETDPLYNIDALYQKCNSCGYVFDYIEEMDTAFDMLYTDKIYELGGKYKIIDYIRKIANNDITYKENKLLENNSFKMCLYKLFPGYNWNDRYNACNAFIREYDIDTLI